MKAEPRDDGRGVATYIVRHVETRECLYVGLSNEPEHRVYIHHLTHSHWTHEPYEVAVCWHADREQARAAERRLIQALRPRDNKQHRAVGPTGAQPLTVEDLALIAEHADVTVESLVRAA